MQNLKYQIPISVLTPLKLKIKQSQKVTQKEELLNFRPKRKKHSI